MSAAARLAAVLAAASAAAAPAAASCWVDSSVEATAQNIVHQSFPGLRDRMPSVLVCESGVFGPNIGGDYTSGIHRIRIPHWQLSTGNLVGVLQHELCHAQDFVDGAVDQRAQAHGVGFMRCLMQRGWSYEAERVASAMGGAAHQTLAEARSLGQGAVQAR